MAENSRFFDSASYTEAQFAETLKKIIIEDGYIPGVNNELEVLPQTPAVMKVDVDTGQAWVQGAWYQNTVKKELAIDAADPSWNRIDRIVLRCSWSGNTITAVVLKGTKAASATAPALTQSAATWELSLAQVSIPAAATEVEAADITDERTTQYCGVAAALLGMMYMDDSGNMNAGGMRVVNLAAPTTDNDAVRKVYVDDAISGSINTTNLTISNNLQVRNDTDIWGNLDVSGNISGTIDAADVAAGDVWHCKTQHYVIPTISNTGSYALDTESRGILILRAGTYRIRFTIYSSNNSYTTYGKIYKNGGAVGTERSITDVTPTEYTEDLALAQGDVIEIYNKMGSGTGYCKDFGVSTTATDADIPGACSIDY